MNRNGKGDCMKDGIEVVSFDVDGTLVSLDFNDLVWLEGIPSLVAEKEGMTFEDARDYTISEYEKVGEGDIRWYKMNHWIEHFGLDTNFDEILSKYQSKIEIFPDVIPALERLEHRYTLILITAMPREFLDIKISGIKHFFQFDFSVISDFKQLKIKESYLNICDRLSISPAQLLHIGDHWEYDYIAPKEAGANAIFLDREKKQSGEFIIHDLDQLKL